MRIKWLVLLRIVLELQSFISLVLKSSTPATNHDVDHESSRTRTKNLTRNGGFVNRFFPRGNVRGGASQPAAAIFKGKRCCTLYGGDTVTCTLESDRNTLQSDRLQHVVVTKEVGILRFMTRQPSKGRGSLLRRELDLVDSLLEDKKKQDKIIQVLHSSLQRKEERELEMAHRGRRSRSRDRRRDRSRERVPGKTSKRKKDQEHVRVKNTV